MSDISTKEAFSALWNNTKKVSRKAEKAVTNPYTWKKAGGYFSNLGRALAGRVEPLKSEEERELEHAVKMARDIILQQEEK